MPLRIQFAALLDRFTQRGGCAALVLLLSITTAEPAAASSVRFSGDATLRYQADNISFPIANRQRLLLISRLNAAYALSDNWSLHGQLSLGNEERQNIGANQLYNFTNETGSHGDLFFSRYYAKGQFSQADLYVGKIPWLTKQVSHVFWDSDLNPYGMHLDYRLGDGHTLSAAYMQPLDGSDGRIGEMWVGQWQWKGQTDSGVKWLLAPWYVDYRGEPGAEIALRDTALDNQFIRMAASLGWQQWQLGLDLGHSLEDFSAVEFAEFADQKDSFLLALSYGGLSQPGHYKVEASTFRVERFAVISEFAHNSFAAARTSNYRGYEMRLRRKMADNWWLGVRFSELQRLVGGPTNDHRFRLEAKVWF